MAMNGKRLIIPFQVCTQLLQQLHSNHMGMEKMRFLVHELVHWVNMNAGIKNTMKQCVICLDYQQTQEHENTIKYDLLCKVL